MLPPASERRPHDYVRHGTTSLFAAYDLASGSVIAQHYRRHQEFLRFLTLIDTAVPGRPAPGPGQLRHPQDRRSRNWITQWNKVPKPFVWTKSADEIRETLAAYCQRITGSGH